MIHINLHIPLAMLSFYPVPWYYSALPFTLSSNTFPGLFCNVDMIEMNYLHFYLCMAVFVSPSCLKDSFNLLTDLFFPSRILNLSFLHLLTSSLLMRSQYQSGRYSAPCFFSGGLCNFLCSSTAVLSTNVFCVSWLRALEIFACLIFLLMLIIVIIK